jgi:DnaK suppressor protein
MSGSQSRARTDTVLVERRSQLEAERRHMLEQAGITLFEFEEVDPEDPTKGRDAVTATLEAMGRKGLDEITAALGRLEAGTYGRCEGCDGAIPDERLEIMPATRFCVGCQQRSE